MNWGMVYGLLRVIVVGIISALVSAGTLTPEQAAALSQHLDNPVALGLMAAVGLGLVVYGAWKKRDAARVLQADAVPGVKVTVNERTAPPAVVEAAKALTNDIILIKDRS